MAAPSVRAQEPRVLVLSPGPEAAAAADELREALAAALGPDARVERMVTAQPDAERPEDWGAAVARSEGADAVVWVVPGEQEADATLWVVRFRGSVAEGASIAIREERAFDRARALALVARTLLEPLFEPSHVWVDQVPPPEGESEPGDEGPLEEPPQAEVPEGLAGTARVDVAEVAAPPEVSLRFALGGGVRSDGPAPSAHVGIEVGFLTYGWLRIEGELVREERGAEPRDRAYLRLAGGAQLAWEMLRVRLGVDASLALAWTADAGRPGVGLLLGFVVAPAVRLTDAIFLELPIGVQGAVARPSPSSLPDVELVVGLAVGVEASL